MSSILVITQEEVSTVEVIAVGPQGPPGGVGGIVLVWDGSDYEPTNLKGSSVPKEFRGPTNPADVPGVILNQLDIWVDTSL